jgi:type III restriction enzyme
MAIILHQVWWRQSHVVRRFPAKLVQPIRQQYPTVMGMLAAWTILNKITDQRDKRFSDTVLIICPNVTIRKRLGALDPHLGETTLYRARKLVPKHRMPELRRGEVWITNWHNLERRQVSIVNGVSAKVVKRGVPITTLKRKTIPGEKAEVAETRHLESEAAWLRRVLGDRKGRSRSVFVFNDEAHHAYRRGDLAEDEEATVLDEETAKRDDREATVWIDGRDRINRVLGSKGRGIRLCVACRQHPLTCRAAATRLASRFLGWSPTSVSWKPSSRGR